MARKKKKLFLERTMIRMIETMHGGKPRRFSHEKTEWKVAAWMEETADKGGRSWRSWRCRLVGVSGVFRITQVGGPRERHKGTGKWFITLEQPKRLYIYPGWISVLGGFIMIFGISGNFASVMLTNTLNPIATFGVVYGVSLFVLGIIMSIVQWKRK